ncbi:MAG: hypothetical protein ACUVQG_00390 [Thermogutta sp.]
MTNDHFPSNQTHPDNVASAENAGIVQVRLPKRLRAFLAGVMQGSIVEKGLVSQDYREIIRTLLQQYLPEVEVYDPLADHKKSLDYDRQTGREVFFYHNRLCQTVDLLIAFLPQASMGTAIEMWEAYQHGAVVISISPMRHNWVVKFLSHRIYPDVESFQAALQTGEIKRVLDLRQQVTEIHSQG